MRTAIAELYTPITAKDFDRFIEMFEQKRGKDQTRGYDPFVNNCAGTIQGAIHHFFKDNVLAAHIYY